MSSLVTSPSPVLSPLSLCTVTGRVFDVTGTPMPDYGVYFHLLTGSYEADGIVPAQRHTAYTDATGAFSVQLWRNESGQVPTRYRVDLTDDRFEFSIPVGTSAATLAGLRLANTSVPTVGTPQYNQLLTFVQDRAPDSAEVETNAIASTLKNDPEFILLTKGERGLDGDSIVGPAGEIGPQGPRGIPGISPEPPEPETIAAALKADTDFVDSIRGSDGADGISPDPVEASEVAPLVTPLITAELKSDAAFQNTVRGARGERGPDGDSIIGPQGIPGEDASASDVAALLKNDAVFLADVEGLPGADGRDASASEVAPLVTAELKSDSDFLLSVKGDSGSSGSDGVNGQDSDPIDVAAALANDAAFVESARGPRGFVGERGADGISPDPVEASEVAPLVTTELKSDSDFLLSVKGDRGEPGLDGQNADPNQVPLATLQSPSANFTADANSHGIVYSIAQSLTVTLGDGAGIPVGTQFIIRCVGDGTVITLSGSSSPVLASIDVENAAVGFVWDGATWLLTGALGAKSA